MRMLYNKYYKGNLTLLWAIYKASEVKESTRWFQAVS